MDERPEWEQALELEHYIRDYVPPQWNSPLAQLMFIPTVLVPDLREIMEGNIPNKFKKQPAILWAIRAYLLSSK